MTATYKASHNHNFKIIILISKLLILFVIDRIYILLEDVLKYTRAHINTYTHSVE